MELFLFRARVDVIIGSLLTRLRHSISSLHLGWMDGAGPLIRSILVLLF